MQLACFFILEGGTFIEVLNKPNLLKLRSKTLRTVFPLIAQTPSSKSFFSVGSVLDIYKYFGTYAFFEGFC